MNLEVMNDLGHIVNQLIELGSSAGCTHADQSLRS